MASEYAAVKLFYSYSHKDEHLREQLEVHLSILKREGRIIEWYDRKILPGQDWGQAIDGHLDESDLILILISPDFIASDYCYGKELTRAIERNEARQAVLVPVILRPTDWAQLPFAKLQAVPEDARPITTWSNQDEAWLDVARKVRATIDEIGQRKRSRTGKEAGLTEVRELLTDEVERIDSRYTAPPGTYGGYQTGFTDLDNMIDGLHPGDLFVISGMPAADKADLALSIAANVAAKGRLPVAIFSMRLSSREVTRSLTAYMGGLNVHQLLRGTLAEADWSRLVEAVGTLVDAQISIDDSISLTVDELRAKTENELSKRGKLGLIVIDSLQNLQPSGYSNPSSVDVIIRSVRALARKCAVPILCTCQLFPRQSRPGRIHFPTLEDLGDWRLLEEEADILAILDPYLSTRPDELDSTQFALAIAKNSRGTRVTLKLPRYGFRFETEEDTQERAKDPT